MVKRRTFVTGGAGGTTTAYNYPSGTIASTISQRYYAYDTGVLIASKGHPFRRKDGADHGGPFHAVRITQSPANHQVNWLTKIGSVPSQGFNGSVAASSYACSQAPPGTSIGPSSDLTGLGATGIARSLPTNPLANLGQFLGELHELPRPIDPIDWYHKAKKFRSLAHKGSDEFLNVQFGWIPFINDIVDFFKVAHAQSKHIQQFSRDSGRNVRRSCQVTESSDSSTTVLQATGAIPFGHNMSGTFFTTTGKLTKTVTTTRRAWFSGCFTYYLPPASDWFGRFEAYAHHLYGLRLDPNLLWQLTPWSWALDWVANYGDIIKNWSAFTSDGLIMRYGYIMEHKVITTQYSLTGVVTKQGPLPDLVDTVTEECKYRAAASPYGFGLNPNTFSMKQNAIIAALGINRLTGWR